MTTKTRDLSDLLDANGDVKATHLDNAPTTTINNNANNRIITGSGSANTLEGETNLTFDGTNLDLPDDKKIRLGTGNDIQLYHDGANSYFTGGNIGAFYIRGGTSGQGSLNLTDASGGYRFLVGNDGGATEIYHNATNALKLATTSTGVFIDTTSTNTGVDSSSTGFYLRDGGQLRVARDNSQPIVANRLNGDGVILDLRKDGATVGQLSAQSGGMGFNVGSSASEALRIDTSGNVLVGKTSADSGGSVGTELLSGRMFLRRSGGAPIIADRDTSNGDIVLLRRAGTNVGILGGVGTELFLGSNAGSGSYLNFGSNRIIPASNTGGNRDNVINLGNSASRFSDLYLGGNIYLGGTGSANALDDYEEGTWTPTIANMSVSGSFSASGRYVKVGKMVLAYGTFSATGSIAYGGSGLLGSFPFQGAVTDNGTVTYVSLSSNSASGGIGLGDFISSRFFFKNDFTTTGANQKTTFTAMYEAN